MKKNHLFFILSFAFVFFSCKKAENQDSITAYAYSSFTAEWGCGPKIAELFNEKHNCKVNFIPCEDGPSILSKAVSEKKSPKADILIGIDNQLIQRAKDEDVLEPYKPEEAKNIDDDLVMGDWILTPYDFGYFAFMYNTETLSEPPESLEDLTLPEYSKKIVIMDPRSSTPGLGFASWIQSAYGEQYLGFWKKIKSNILTMSPGWSAGYNLFVSGEAPLVLSYTTSLAAHILYDKTEKFQPIIFKDGHVMQIEGVGLVKNSKNKMLAKKFIDFMLSKEVQELIPETQFMFPSVKNTKLPTSFEKIPSPSKILYFEPQEVSENIDSIIEAISE